MGDRENTEYHSKAIGGLAFQALEQDQEAVVLGTTSRGIFVSIENRRVVFLSFETHRGPLTINLAGPFNPLRRIVTGSPARIGAGRLVFPVERIAISTHPVAIWHHPAPIPPARPVSEQIASLAALAQKVVSMCQHRGFGALLPRVLSWPEALQATSVEGGKLASLLSLRQALAARDVVQAAHEIAALLGLGEGLTPSGDDCVIGVLLTLNRWQKHLWPSRHLEELNRRVVGNAHQKTTLISATLLECAAAGAADERLLAAIDYVMAGSPTEATCVSGLLGWGASSGADALVGMALAITSQVVALSDQRVAPIASHRVAWSRFTREAVCACLEIGKPSHSAFNSWQFVKFVDRIPSPMTRLRNSYQIRFTERRKPKDEI